MEAKKVGIYYNTAHQHSKSDCFPVALALNNFILFSVNSYEAIPRIYPI